MTEYRARFYGNLIVAILRGCIFGFVSAALNTGSSSSYSVIGFAFYLFISRHRRAPNA